MKIYLVKYLLYIWPAICREWLAKPINDSSHHPKSIPALTELAGAYENSNQLKNALKALSKAYELSSDLKSETSEQLKKQRDTLKSKVNQAIKNF
jgi:hypothetical protein